VVLRQERKPGEKMFVEWGNQTPIYGPNGGPIKAGTSVRHCAKN
jgi:hypothetical protein